MHYNCIAVIAVYSITIPSWSCIHNTIYFKYIACTILLCKNPENVFAICFEFGRYVVQATCFGDCTHLIPCFKDQLCLQFPFKAAPKYNDN